MGGFELCIGMQGGREMKLGKSRVSLMNMGSV